MATASLHCDSDAGAVEGAVGAAGGMLGVMGNPGVIGKAGVLGVVEGAIRFDKLGGCNPPVRDRSFVGTSSLTEDRVNRLNERAQRKKLTRRGPLAREKAVGGTQTLQMSRRLRTWTRC